MVGRKNIFLLLVVLSFVSVLFFVLSSGFISAASCWEHDQNQTGCEAETDYHCSWHSDSWGSWCEEVNCWSLWSETECTNSTLLSEIGRNCTWKSSSGGNWGWCEQASCWSYTRTNQTWCENSTAHGLSCEWSSHCGGYNPSTNCWEISTQSQCNNVTGCSWGECQDTSGCGDYWTSATCAGQTGREGNNCTWNSDYSYCYEASCWNYAGTNESWCETNSPLGTAMNCTWIDNSFKSKACESPMCSFWDMTNASTCVNNTFNLDCEWDGQWCMTKGCWQYNLQSSCNGVDGCFWNTPQSSGWCEEVQCWSWDSWNGGNNSQCVNNSYGLNCAWGGINSTDGWCYVNMTAGECANYTSERECMDTYYCWWQWNDWNDVSAGGSCSNPQWGNGTYDDQSIFDDWNPGCYIFDFNSTDCNSTIGCAWSGNTCANTGENSTNPDINVSLDYLSSSGLNCSMFNSSRLCNNIPALSTCCQWVGGNCTSKLGKSCWDNADREQDELGGITACSDVSMLTSDSNSARNLCNQVAGSPLYMPCQWANESQSCGCKATNIFGNSTNSFALIDNKKVCNSCGGKWIEEYYCAGNTSVPAGRCEQKGQNERNCDKACFACEYTFSGKVHNSSAVAKKYCYDSTLGYCEFTVDTSAPNGYGYCRAKEEFKQGIAADCKTDCGSCTYTGNPYADSYSSATPPAQPTYGVCNTPECYCEHAYEFNNVTCKWIEDASNENGGFCAKKSDKVCEDACDRCYTRTNCKEKGRTATGAEGSCEWSNDDSETDGACSKISGGDGVSEVCWDGVDNDADGLIDCSDSGCYSDSFCGFVSGDCFGWNTEASCEATQLSSGLNCSWVSDPWGSWCDFPGSDCWKKDGNQTACREAIRVVNETLNITLARLANNNINETYTFQLLNLGSGWVNTSIVIINASGFSLNGNYSVNIAQQTISFANNTFMISGGGAGNLTNVTYIYYPVSASCKWNTGSGSGWCEQDWSLGQDCYSAGNSSLCSVAGNCTWTVDPWCSGDGANNDWCTDKGGWCDPAAFAPKNCWQYDNNVTGCGNVAGCVWDDPWCMEQGCWNYDGNQTACGNAEECEWETNEWQSCQINWESSCWQFNSSSTCGANNCTWRTAEWNPSGWCDHKFSVCWDLTEGTCASNVNCLWDPYMWRWNPQTGQSTQGSCEAKCNNNSLNSVQCGAIDGCMWNTGWCMSSSQSSSSSGLNCWNYDSNQTACGNAAGCKWKNPGWCDPLGFSGGGGATSVGSGGSTGMECWKYDGNEASCTNSSAINMTCIWMPEFRPFCEPDWSADCWRYNNASNVDGVRCGINATGCYWNSNGNYCTNVFDQCWNNATLSSNSTLCDANANCNWTNGWEGYNGSSGSGWCEPSCFGATTEGDCTGSCVWKNGWCNSPGMSGMFGGMQAGAPVIVAQDSCDGEIAQEYLDICGVGLKDMEGTFGFGSGVANFADAGICNNKKVGFGNTFGNGNKTVKYYVYLDTDGSTSGGCTLSNDATSGGYEFFFRYVSTYNQTLGKATETFTAKKCSGSTWGVADITLSAWKEKMCGEIQGPMIAVKKSDLEKFPTLYDSQEDMRVYVTTAGSSGNASSPADVAGPGWVTPGAIDFSIGGFFDIGANGAIFENILLGGGYVTYEDCFNGVDDNSNGLIDCLDWECEFVPHCVDINRGVDTSMPIIKGVKVEEYPDSALIMYSTNKPSNGTVTFWYNDSSCSSTPLNRTVEDSGIYLDSVREFKLWHHGLLYNDTGIRSLDYPLSSDTTYYYKIKICDSANKCSVSACTSLRTATTSRCGYCNFVTIISPPSGWKVSYDLNTDGVYEHVQGSVCGPNSGMKTNYTTGRKANIKLNDSSGAEMIFENATLTKTGLTTNTRTINTAGDLIHDNDLTDASGGAVELVGMVSTTRDKIINNLHPEVCKVRIPNDDCSELWHCDNAGDNCDRVDDEVTSPATGVADGTACVWTIPFCEF